MLMLMYVISLRVFIVHSLNNAIGSPQETQVPFTALALSCTGPIAVSYEFITMSIALSLTINFA